MSTEPLRVLEGGGAPRGWERLWAKDAWGQTELPHGDLASMYRGEEFIRFDRKGGSLSKSGGRGRRRAPRPRGRRGRGGAQWESRSAPAWARGDDQVAIGDWVGNDGLFE
jgi:hypothetical protein